jgi:hypothetical protein
VGTVLLALLLSQQQVTQRTYDINGHAVAGVRSATDNGSSQTTVRNVNGREVPVETVDERVVSDGVVE